MALAQLVAVMQRRLRRSRADVYGVTSLILLSLAFLSPALKDGLSVGGFDYDTTRTPLGSGVYTVVHAVTNGDAVSQMISWNDLSWHLIHAGHFPLWNQFSVLGMPQFLNFESSVLSLPDLLSYLVPVRFAFLVVVAAKLIIASTGAYLFARVIGCRPLSATFAGVAFMFAGAFSSWLTWPLSDVFAWSGWICALALVAYRPQGRLRHVVVLAIVVAFSIYGGFPEANAMFGVGMAAFVLAALVALLALRRRIEFRGVMRAGIGLVGGAGLAAPLWLPGLQVIAISHRTSEGAYVGLPTRALALLFSQGYYGLPTGPHPVLQMRLWPYYESVSYVGVVAAALVIVAVVTSIRRPVVAGLFFALLVSLAISYQPVGFHPLQSAINHLPYLKMVRFERMRTFTAFVIAILAALGLERIVQAPRERATKIAVLLGSLFTALVVVYLDVDSALKPAVRHARVGALLWPSISVVLLLALVGLLWSRSKWLSKPTSASVIAAGLMAFQTAFLFFAGVGVLSYSKPFFQSTTAVAKLQSIVGTALVGLNGGNVTNVRSFKDVGFYPNVNIGYSIRIFGVHDPLIPASYFASWPDQSAAPNAHGVGLFVPDVNSVMLAERYGIAFVLTRAGVPVPVGMQTVAVIAGETLSRVAHSSTFSFLSGPRDSVTSSSTNGNGSWRVTTSGPSAGELVLRITDLPGLHALIDGKPLVLQRYESVMLRAQVPAGRHIITVNYLPSRLKLGLVLALLVVISFGGAGMVALRRTRVASASHTR